MLLRIVIDFFK